MLTLLGQYLLLWHSTCVLKNTRFPTDLSLNMYMYYLFDYMSQWRCHELTVINFFFFFHLLQLKMDKLKLIEFCGTSESEFFSVRELL